MVGIQDLTVAQVSGMIAAAVFVVQFLVPLSLPLILLGLLQRRNYAITQTAVSWSVIGRFMHSSLWPAILGTDSAATFAARRSALCISAFRIFMLILVAVAAIVTPLGLYEGVIGTVGPASQDFNYIKDRSTFGLGTPPRTAASGTWSRICGFTFPIVCPNSKNNITYTKNATGDYLQYDWYDSKIPSSVVDAFHSGLINHQPSVASIFDIQYRSYIQSELDMDGKGPVIDNGTNPFTKGTFQPLSTLILSDSYLAVEGLVVDMKNGGIGFRNHTAPPPRPYGSSWSEDLLFVEPDTVCVDTNLTLDFRIPVSTDEKVASGPNGVFRLQLTDRGGFVNLHQEYPVWSRVDTQQDPELHLRAYKAAWLNNALSMAFMNVTNIRNNTTGLKAFSYLNSTPNQTFPLSYADGKQANNLLNIQPSSFQVARNFGEYLEDSDQGRSNTSTFNTTSTISLPSYPPLYTNPFGVRSSCTYSTANCTGFDSADITCAGSGGGDIANITNMAGKCGLLYGTPRRQDGGSSLLFDPGSAWTLPMYSCMSVVKASIKSVTFRFNDTDDLSGLTVLSIADKVYPNEESKPLWGVENTNMQLKHGNPLWGIVSPSTAASLNISTLRKEFLYLPGYAGISTGLTSHENLPGADFASAVLSATYDVGPYSMGSKVDYSGKANLAMYRLWQDYFRTAPTSAKILNLIWTDIASNLVVGTKGLRPGETRKQRRNEEPTTNVVYPQVTYYSRRIQYRYVYGIPAFLALLLTAACAFLTAYVTIFGNAKPSAIRSLLEHTSTGRLLTARDVQDRQKDGTTEEDCVSADLVLADCNQPTKEWSKGAGATEYTLSADGWTKHARSQEPGYDKVGTTASYVPVPSTQTV